MTEKITLESIAEKFRDVLFYQREFGNYRYGMPDCNVMTKLGFTPQSWSRYRPLLMQYCEYNDLVKIETRGDTTLERIRIRMRYDRKSRIWYGKNRPLMIDDKEKNTWRDMTEEEMEKYGIVWYADEDYLYDTHHTM